MCRPKDEGPRCFHHGYERWQKNAERIERDNRILRNGQELTEEEEARLTELASRPDTLTRAERNELHILQRIPQDDQELTPQEVHYYKQNLATRDSLDADLNTTAVAHGAVKQKELSLLYGDIIKEFVQHDPEARTHPRKGSIAEFLTRLASDPDTPLTPGEERLAMELYETNPAFFNARHELLGGNGRSTQLSEASFAELRDLVRRYNNLHPRRAPQQQQAAHEVVTVLRETEHALAQLLQSTPLEADVVAALPATHRDVYLRGKATPRLFTLALAQDKRIALHGLYARQAQVSFPRLYNASTEVEELDRARAVVPVLNAPPTSTDFAARREELAQWEERIRNGKWASLSEVRFETVPPVVVEPVSAQPDKRVLADRLAKSQARRTPATLPSAPASTTTPTPAPANLPPLSRPTVKTTPVIPKVMQQPTVAPAHPARTPSRTVPPALVKPDGLDRARKAPVTPAPSAPAPPPQQGELSFFEWVRRHFPGR